MIEAVDPESVEVFNFQEEFGLTEQEVNIIQTSVQKFGVSKILLQEISSAHQGWNYRIEKNCRILFQFKIPVSV